MTKARDIASAAPAPAGVTSTELGYVDGVTSAIQTQVDAKIAKTLTTTTGDIIYASSANTPARLGIGSTDQVLKVTGGVPAWATPATSASGLTLIKTQTIGSAVTAVTVTDAFSATYDNYLITVNGGSGNVAGGNCNLTLGSTTSGYYQAGYYMFWGNTALTGNVITNGAKWEGSFFSANAHSAHINLQNPFLAKTTIFNNNFTAADTTAYMAMASGWLNNTTSYTAFTLTANSGNITGGTIRVYGYQNS